MARFSSGQKRLIIAIVAIAVVALVVIIAVKFGGNGVPSTPADMTNVNTFGVKPKPVPSPIVSTPPSPPPTGAASLSVDTCGCPSSGSAPTCATERRWNVSKLWNEDTNAFEITHVAEDRMMVSGIFELIVTNSGSPSTTLTSIVVELEKAVAGFGDAPGPSGDNFLKIAAAVANADSSSCNNPSNPIANICSKSTAFTVSGTAGSNLIVKDSLGNSIVSLESAIINSSKTDNDGDGKINEDSPDGAGICNTTNNLYGVDDDNDGLIDEDGVCADSVHFKLYYAFYLSSSAFNSIAGASVRVNVLATFLSVGDRGGTCSTDTNCDGTIQTAEKNARTVQHRIPFTFPTFCPPKCTCIDFNDAKTIDARCDTFNQGSYTFLCPNQYSPSATYTDSEGAFEPTCITDNTTFYENITLHCPEDSPYDSKLTIHDVVGAVSTLQSTDPLDCVDIFGNSLIQGTPAQAIATYYCEGVEGPAQASPSPIPTPSGFVPYVPPPGSQCSYTRGIFAQSCSKPANVDDCTNSNAGGVQPGCVVKSCSSIMYPTVFNITLPSPNSQYHVALQPTTPSQMPDFIKLFVTSHTGTPFHFTSAQTFTALALPGQFATSAGNLGAQLTTALFNRDKTLRFGTTEQKDIFRRLYVREEECGNLAPFTRGIKLGSLINITQCITSLANTNPSVPISQAICKSKCSYTENYVAICDEIFSTYTVANNWISNGVTLWSALTTTMTEYNEAFDECEGDGGCFLVGPSNA